MVTLTLLKFSVRINASQDKVWDALWSDASYRQWTSAFSPGSYAESDWKEGSKIKFLTEEGDGMFSVIEVKKPNTQMTFRHLGIVLKGKEEIKTKESEDWEGAKESYFLSENNGITELNVEVDVTNQYQDYFNKTFPKALEIVKNIAEK
ncbi:SRPBCC domain-containing protein [Sporocytophaga myxococcoides]|uniref:SRPBCC domain-containing protein n=1 Tax=Sporocytophaga myxococcoides TaxID=153721 RepID=UPI00055C5220|nr:SRPBCC domain-containing protein [Sporocytophaga myxococcoides]